MAILRMKTADGRWVEIPAIVGTPGPKGDPGTGVTILGSYDTVDALTAAHPAGNAGDAYLVGGDLYVWSATSSTWVNVGRIKGEPGKDGAPGTSVTIKSITESTEDGGSNRVTFSDGSLLTIKNGTPGRDGNDGRDGASVTVVSIAESTEDGGSSVIAFSDGSLLTVKNGKAGSAGKDGTDGKDGAAGKDGASITVKSVSESTVDGGSSVITFSDGTTVTIKNGKAGSMGAAGKSAYQYAKDGGYTGTEAEFAARLAAAAAEYLALTGGVMTGEIKIGQGDGKGIQLGTDGRINATTAEGSTTATVFGLVSGDAVFGHSSFNSTFRGKASRPTYNGANMALQSDIPSAVATESANGLMSAQDKVNLNKLVSSAISVLSGSATPTADMGEDGDVYLVTG